MHQEFGEWYRGASVDPRDVPLELRWAGVEAIAKEAGTETVANLVRLYVGLPVSEESLETSIRRQFRDADPAFRSRDNELELQVLAGATLVRLLESRRSAIPNVATLAVLAAAYSGTRRGAGVEDLPERAAMALRRRIVDRRRSNEESGVKAVRDLARTAKVDLAAFKVRIDEAGNSGSTQSFATAVNGIADELARALDEVRSVVPRAFRELQASQRALQEESNAVWWVFGGWSRDLDKPFRVLGIPAATLIAGKELSDIAADVPGPLAAEVLLDRLLSGATDKALKPTTLVDAVNASPKEWRRMLPHQPEDVADITPTLLALRRSMETDGERDWVPAVSQVSGIDPTKACEPVRLSLAAYHESMLLRALGEV